MMPTFFDSFWYGWFPLTAFITAGLVWLCLHRENKRWLSWRLLATVVALASLVLMVFPPTLSREVATGEAILLTEGFQTDTLARLVQQPKPPRVYSYQQTVSGAQRIEDLAAWQRAHPQVRNLHVLGYGLTPDQLTAFDSTQLIFHPTQPSGLTFLHWLPRVRLGQRFTITGRYQQQDTTSTWLYCSLAGVVQDSVKLSPAASQSFSLHCQPKATGRWLYQLRVQQGRLVLAEESIPVEVLPVQPLRVLMLAAFPAFETKFLKNYLAGRQYTVAVRAAISRDKFETEWINAESPQARLPLNRLSPTLLSTFDLLLIDTQTLLTLSAGELKIVQNAIRQDGLGLLLIPGQLPLQSKQALLSPFQTEKLAGQETQPTAVRWNDGPLSAPIPAPPFHLNPSDKLRSYVQDAQHLTRVAGYPLGWGKVALTLLPETYQWALAGKEQQYQDYWAYLLSMLARKQSAEQEWTVPARLAVHQPARMQLRDYTVGSAPAPQGTVASDTEVADTESADTYSTPVEVSFAQDVRTEGSFEATFWPAREGWHRIQTVQDQPYYFYVHPAQAWPSWQQAEKLAQTQQFVQGQKQRVVTSGTTFVESAVSPFYFFLLFLLSAGFLWLEEKL